MPCRSFCMQLQTRIGTRCAPAPHTSKPYSDTNFCYTPSIKLKQAFIQGGLLFKDLQYIYCRCFILFMGHPYIMLWATLLQVHNYVCTQVNADRLLFLVNKNTIHVLACKHNQPHLLIIMFM